jgi:hypothetical protein
LQERLTGERRSVNLFATDYQLRDGFAEIVLKSEMTGSSAAKRAEATGLNSTVIARLAGRIAMAGGFALSEVAISMQFRSRSSRRFDLLPRQDRRLRDLVASVFGVEKKRQPASSTASSGRVPISREACVNWRASVYQPTRKMRRGLRYFTFALYDGPSQFN